MSYFLWPRVWIENLSEDKPVLSACNYTIRRIPQGYLMVLVHFPWRVSLRDCGRNFTTCIPGLQCHLDFSFRRQGFQLFLFFFLSNFFQQFLFFIRSPSPDFVACNHKSQNFTGIIIDCCFCREVTSWYSEKHKCCCMGLFSVWFEFILFPPSFLPTLPSHHFLLSLCFQLWYQSVPCLPKESTLEKPHSFMEFTYFGDWFE